MQSQNKCYVFKQTKEKELPEFYFSVGPDAASAEAALRKKFPQLNNLAGPKEWPKSVCDYFRIDLTKPGSADNIRRVWNWEVST